MVTRLLQPHERRVVDEQAELAERLQKLNSFLESPRVASIDWAERERLVRQQSYMTRYLEVLNERIAAFC